MRFQESPCCELVSGPYGDGRVIHETPNFFVSTALGPMGIPGYLLIISRDHVFGSGELPSNTFGELDDLLSQTRARIQETYRKQSTMFEHGPGVGKCGWGGCIDHMHLHVIPGVEITNPFAIDLMSRIDQKEQFYRVDRIEGFKRTADIWDAQKTSYVMLEPYDQRRLVAEVNFPGQSQWLRRLTANEIGSKRWNWRFHPDKERAMQTASELAGKFS